MSNLWKNDRSESTLAKKVEQFTVGDDHLLDQYLVPYDVKASSVHAEALHKAGVLSGEECEALCQALQEVLILWEEDRFGIRPEQEDVHTAIEQFLVEKLGETGRKIHAGRSRNDQVLVAMRMYQKDRLHEIAASVRVLVSVLLDRAEQYAEIPMPGYTHTRRAMLSSVGMWLASLAEMLLLDLESVRAAYRAADRCPLGSAAGYGTSFDLPREEVAEKLGFSAPLTVSLTAQNTRSRIDLQVVQSLETVTATLAHFAGDLLTWTSESHNFFRLDEAFHTGSSIMPQKRNMDSAELLRARHSILAGAVQAIRINGLKLNSGYHRDHQLTKAPVMNAFREAGEMLEMARLMAEHLVPQEGELAAACSPELFAADRANELVKEGLPFREAYHRVKNSLDELKGEDPVENIRSKTHLGAPGNLGIDRLREACRGFSLDH